MNHDDPHMAASQHTSKSDALLEAFFHDEFPAALNSDVPPFRRPNVVHAVTSSVGTPARTASSGQRGIVVLLSVAACVVLAIVISALPSGTPENSAAPTNLAAEEVDTEMGGMPVSSGAPFVDDESGIALPEHEQIEFPAPPR